MQSRQQQQQQQDLKQYQEDENSSKRRQTVTRLVRSLRRSENFKERCLSSSLFYLGSGSSSHAFRAVTRASGLEDPRYPPRLLQNIHDIVPTISCRRSKLIPVDERDDSCLDLVALKVESSLDEDHHERSLPKCRLIREFAMLKELFRKTDSSMSMVGIPLPIDFGFFGTEKPQRRYDVTSLTGEHVTFEEMYICDHPQPVVGLRASDVRLDSYMMLEMVGPSITEWLAHFNKNRLSVQTVLKLMDQVLCRLLVLHRKDAVHLDLRPENIRFGVGKKLNTVYLMDYRLSRFCSNFTPLQPVGLTKYMSVDMHRRRPANYTMDVESWFYLLTELLCGWLPWAEEVTAEEVVLQLKEQFWFTGSKLAAEAVGKVRQCDTSLPLLHKQYLEIYLQVKSLLRKYRDVNHWKMNEQLQRKDSELRRCYNRLRLLLLFVYDIELQSEHSCFQNDADVEIFTKRMRGAKKLFYALGADWRWDWDVWFDEQLEQQQQQSSAEPV